MNVETFTAATMSEAVAQIKERLGRDAVILNTRVLQRRTWLGLRKTNVIQVMARPSGKASPASTSTSTSTADAVARQPAARRSTSSANPSQHPTTASTQAAAPTRPLPSVASNASAGSFTSSSAVLETPMGVAAVVKTLTGEMESLRRSVQGLQRDVVSAGLSLPPELVPYHQALTAQQVDSEIGMRLMQHVRDAARPDQWAVPTAVAARLAAAAERLLPVSGPMRRVKTCGPHVVCLLGPTGVGKTTTIAKLAAHVKLHGRKRVGLITIDTYRIAAVDQLKRYAEILTSPLKVVASPTDLARAIAELADMDYVLIDSAGRSPSDALQLSELARFQQAAKPDETHLVLSLTASPSCLDFAVDRFGGERFGGVAFDRLLLTKADESPTLGQMVGLIARVGRPVSYLTTGQDVPDHIELASSPALARRLVDAAFSHFPGFTPGGLADPIGRTAPAGPAVFDGGRSA